MKRYPNREKRKINAAVRLVLIRYTEADTKSINTAIIPASCINFPGVGTETKSEAWFVKKLAANFINWTKLLAGKDPSIGLFPLHIISCKAVAAIIRPEMASAVISKEETGIESFFFIK